MRYFIIAGEASGDLHGAALIEALRAEDPEAAFTFLGGDRMTAAAGCEPVIHNRDMAFMGFSEVLRNLGKIFGNMRRTRRALAASGADCLILIDYPSFNLKVAKTAKKLGLPVYYYISPKIWAWKEWRVKAIKKTVDRMFSILPFEKDFYARHDYAIDYVGNPSVEEIDALRAHLASRADFLSRWGLRDRPIIALLPGSRLGEIRCNLPLMIEASDRFPQYRAVIAGAPGIADEVYAAYSDLPVVRDATYDLLANSRAAIVTSGTATLETALLGVPQVVVYHSNGSKLAYKIMRRFIKVDYISLPNLIVDRPMLSELILHNCTTDTIADSLMPLLRNGEARSAMLDGYAEMRRRLGDSTAAVTTARLLVDDLRKRKTSKNDFS